MDKDQEQLKILSVFHYVVAGMTALFSLIPIFHVILGGFRGEVTTHFGNKLPLISE